MGGEGRCARYLFCVWLVYKRRRRCRPDRPGEERELRRGGARCVSLERSEKIESPSLTLHSLIALPAPTLISSTLLYPMPLALSRPLPVTRRAGASVTVRAAAGVSRPGMRGRSLGRLCLLSLRHLIATRALLSQFSYPLGSAILSARAQPHAPRHTHTHTPRHVTHTQSDATAPIVSRRSAALAAAAALLAATTPRPAAAFLGLGGPSRDEAYAQDTVRVAFFEKEGAHTG